MLACRQSSAHGVSFYLCIGESAVGKSSLVHRFVNRSYEDNREPTIGGKKGGIGCMC